MPCRRERDASFNDLWAFDGRRWTALPSSGLEVWGLRLAFDSERRRVVAFGGISNRRAISDVRVLENDTWVTLGQHTEMPAAEAGFVYDSRRDRFVAFGGTLGDGSAYGDTWEFAGGAWAKVASPGQRARQGHAMVFDEQRGRTVIFAGTGSYGADQTPPRLGDLWEFDGQRWTAREFANGPSSRTSPGAHMTRSEASPSSSAASTAAVSLATCARGTGPSGGSWLKHHPPGRFHEPRHNSPTTKSAIESCYSADATDGPMVT
jgi:hypothetical protein